MLSCLEILSISTSTCFVHLQSLLKITPICLCICTGDSEILLKSNSTLFSKCLVLKIIISVLLGLNCTSHLYDHAFKYYKFVLINVFKFSSLCAIWPIQESSANSLPKPVKLSATLYIKIRKSNGSKTNPWGTPAFYSPVLGVASVITTRCFRLER